MTAAVPGTRATERPRRLPVVDRLRGGALLAMAFYHLTWDLAYFGFIDPAVPFSPALKFYAHGVAAVFLLLVGVSLVLAHEARVRPWRIARRLLLLTAASAAISLVTRLLFPKNFIFFGTLHCIALASLLALPCLAAPVWLPTAIGAAVLALPAFVGDPAFDSPWLWWTGLGAQAPPTLDYRPLFPWAGFVFLGLAAARILLSRTRGMRRPAPQTAGPSRALEWAGRHSLLVYLAHQPPILAVLFAAAFLLAPAPSGGETAFDRSCEQRCAASAIASSVCAKACGCVARELKAEDLLAKAAAGGLRADESETLRAIGRDCWAASAGRDTRKP